MAHATHASAAGKEPGTFEEAVKELEQILGEIESGRTTLEDSLKKYERGMQLLKHCRAVLASAEKQIELLSKDEAGDGGGMLVQPLGTSGDGTSGRV